MEDARPVSERLTDVLMRYVGEGNTPGSRAHVAEAITAVLRAGVEDHAVGAWFQGGTVEKTPEGWVIRMGLTEEGRAVVRALGLLEDDG